MKYLFLLISAYIVFLTHTHTSFATDGTVSTPPKALPHWEVGGLFSMKMAYDLGDASLALGGDAYFSYRFTKRFSLGFRTGGYDDFNDDVSWTSIPFDILATWDMPFMNGRISVPIIMALGYGLGIRTWHHRGDQLLYSLIDIVMETGIKVRFNDTVGISVLASGGCFVPIGSIPIMSVGAKVGPFFAF